MSCNALIDKQYVNACVKRIRKALVKHDPITVDQFCLQTMQTLYARKSTIGAAELTALLAGLGVKVTKQEVGALFLEYAQRGGLMYVELLGILLPEDRKRAVWNRTEAMVPGQHGRVFGLQQGLNPGPKSRGHPYRETQSRFPVLSASATPLPGVAMGHHSRRSASKHPTRGASRMHPGTIPTPQAIGSQRSPQKLPPPRSHSTPPIIFRPPDAHTVARAEREGTVPMPVLGWPSVYLSPAPNVYRREWHQYPEMERTGMVIRPPSKANLHKQEFAWREQLAKGVSLQRMYKDPSLCPL